MDNFYGTIGTSALGILIRSTKVLTSTIKTNLDIGLVSILGMDLMIWLIYEELTPMVDSGLFLMCIRVVLSL